MISDKGTETIFERITSSEGELFKDSINTVLTYSIFEGNKDITSKYSSCKWERISDDPESDIAFNLHHAQWGNLLEISDGSKAKYTCSVIE